MVELSSVFREEGPSTVEEGEHQDSVQYRDGRTDGVVAADPEAPKVISVKEGTELQAAAKSEIEAALEEQLVRRVPKLGAVVWAISPHSEPSPVVVLRVPCGHSVQSPFEQRPAHCCRLNGKVGARVQQEVPVLQAVEAKAVVDGGRRTEVQPCSVSTLHV